jgi:hypothetical protein
MHRYKTTLLSHLLSPGKNTSAYFVAENGDEEKSFNGGDTWCQSRQTGRTLLHKVRAGR